MGHYDRAWQHNIAAAEVSDSTGEQRFKAHALQDRAELLRLTGDYAGARAAARAGLALSERQGDADAAARAELNFAWIESDAGRHDLAAAHAQRCLAFAQEANETFLLVGSLVALAHSARQRGDLAAAHPWLEQAFAYCHRAGMTHVNQLSAVHLERGNLAVAAGDWPVARQHFAAALGAAGCIAADAQEAQAGLAAVAWAEQDHATARRLLTEVIDHPATSAAVRQRARELLQRWELRAALAALAGGRAAA